MNEEIEVKVAAVDGSSGEVIMPKRATVGSSCYDLFASLQKNEQSNGSIIPRGGRLLVRTGWILEIPYGFEAQIRSRSGLALKHGIAVLNSPGTIDSDYRGEIGVILINHGQEKYVVQHGVAVAQMAIMQTASCRFVQVDKLSESRRGAGGFGSTDVE